ncbi:succinate dehydrogenase [Cytobacillus sp. Hm23]
MNFYSIKRLHSILGAFPLSVFLIHHLYINWYATRGMEIYFEKLTISKDFPLMLLIEIVFIYIPIILHGATGIYLVTKSKHNVRFNRFTSNILYFFQHITGTTLLLFIIYHLIQHYYLKSFWSDFSRPWMTPVYILGILSAAYHFGNGIRSFLITWGITVTTNAQKVALLVGLIAFFIVTYLGIHAYYSFYIQLT